MQVSARKPLRLDQYLVQAQLVTSRTRAQQAIAAGQVLVDSVPVTKPSYKVMGTQNVQVLQPEQYVSRGAYKLLRALEVFELSVADKLVLDLGASTGGFTQVLLEAGARHVIALDVGHDQLSPVLRADPRVTVVEGCNARFLTAQMLCELTGIDESPQVVVGDLSFISLELIFPAVAKTASQANVCFLIKPQFEVGAKGVQGGIVTDPQLRIAAVQKVIHSAAAAGYKTIGIEHSPLQGTHGNREFLGFWCPDAQPDPAEWNDSLPALVA